MPGYNKAGAVSVLGLHEMNRQDLAIIYSKGERLKVSPLNLQLCQTTNSWVRDYLYLYLQAPAEHSAHRRLPVLEV